MKSVTFSAALLCAIQPAPTCLSDETLYVDPLGQCWCATSPGLGGPQGRAGEPPRNNPTTKPDMPRAIGNPGNDKPVGRAGERPDKKGGWGGGSRGKSDGSKGKGKGK